jgi:hypothetical protein
MSDPPRVDRQPRAVTTLDLLLLTAGFACGLVLHQASSLARTRTYIMPGRPADFRSLLGTAAIGWVWALTVGLTALLIGRRFRYGGQIRPAEWLSVSLAIGLVDSAFPGADPVNPTQWDLESVWVAWYRNGVLARLELYTPRTADLIPYLTEVSLRFSAMAALVGSVWWAFRARLGPGWVAVMTILIATLVTLGPVHQLEAMFPELDRCWLYPSRPSDGAQPWTILGLASFIEGRAWAGYSIRTLWFMLIAILTMRSLRARRRDWYWTEWAALASATLLAVCWAYGEIALRPALDWPVRMTLLGTWLLALAALARLLVWKGTTLTCRIPES